MQTRASNAPSSPAHTTAIMRTTALWTEFWWAPTRQTLPRISVLTARASERSKKAGRREIPPPLQQKNLDEKEENNYDMEEKNGRKAEKNFSEC